MTYTQINTVRLRAQVTKRFGSKGLPENTIPCQAGRARRAEPGRMALPGHHAGAGGRRQRLCRQGAPVSIWRFREGV